jgi:phosphoenolpyruvate carboxylase
MAIAERQLEQVTHAVLIASTPEQARRAESAAVGGRGVLTQIAERSRAAYRELVWEEPLFETYFRGATPIGELSELTLGSRPAARARREPGRAPSLESLRAIPWVFAWTQSRTNLPGWYGLGSALAAYREEHGDAGLDELARLYREWPFLASVLDNAEMILAKADMGIAARYARLVPGREARGLWVRIRREFDTSVELLLRITGHATLLDGMPVLQRSIALRNPYVDSLSEIQVRALARLRALPADDPARAELLRLVHLTVSGVAAGLQNTG